MPGKIATRGAVKRHDHQRHDHYGKHRVSEENDEIDCPYRRWAAKTCCAVKVVIGQIGTEKQDRGTQRRQLTISVSVYSASPNKEIPGEQQDETGEI